MSSTKAAEPGTAYRSPRSGQYSPAPELPVSERNNLSPAYAVTAGDRSAGPFSHVLTAGEIDLTPDEVNELKIFGEYLAKHVQPSGSRDVQCMLLWSEWVRMFWRQVSGFPDLIGEKEFRYAITQGYGADIFTDERRGAVYRGLRFVP